MIAGQVEISETCAIQVSRSFIESVIKSFFLRIPRVLRKVLGPLGEVTCLPSSHTFRRICFVEWKRPSPNFSLLVHAVQNTESRTCETDDRYNIAVRKP